MTDFEQTLWFEIYTKTYDYFFMVEDAVVAHRSARQAARRAVVAYRKASR